MDHEVQAVVGQAPVEAFTPSEQVSLMSSQSSPPSLPQWFTWWQRPFPNANTLLLTGPQPALIDSGFVGHADETAAWARAQAGDVALVVNTHWHSDHVGGNSLLQTQGAAIAAGRPEADAISRRDAGCCAAEYLDQPVAPYTVDMPLDDGQILRLGETDWAVVRTPGHTPGHLALWQPEERLLVVGDALSDYDVGWVNLALDGPEAATTALASLTRIVDLAPRLVFPSHGPIPADPGRALAAAIQRAQRLVDDPDGAVWYGVRRIFAFALMIRGGIPAAEVESYLHARAWLNDAARLLDLTPEVLATELVTTMLARHAIALRDGRLYASTDYTPVPQGPLNVPFPHAWPGKASS
ncbi:MBL fold metallo-hydrolase [Streptomyces sp. NBC_00233]|uniref:MBL fold metallo-hydrolase n=1 Tax=Streptomyces sp. NBC_00233 TaxID=2975686 RepID=UPI002256D8B3|nr:MBL fold metallo-hydrolase [Streptomyces sp. NBC_00233]MCX5233369.1 MBL fold metallo-hydrolase [Streptomyces sp. NBC_00233]